MDNIRIKAYAKVNLSLDIIKKRENGYHDVKMIMQTIDLHDTLFLRKTYESDCITCNIKKIPVNEKNIVYKAVKLIKKEYNIKEGVSVDIIKNIPVAAGLGGGSADAAATLKAMNTLFALKLKNNTLEELGVKLGADVPFLIRGGTALAEGIGEKLTDLHPLPATYLLLVKPDIDVSTKEIYEAFDSVKCEKHPGIDKFIRLPVMKFSKDTVSLMGNVLEEVTINKHKIISHIKEKMLHEGAIFSMMTGSGPTVFGIFKTEEEAETASEKFMGYKDFELIKTVKTLTP